MQELGAVRKALEAGELDAALAHLMCGDPAPGRQRVSRLLDGFCQAFGAGEGTPVTICPPPGRRFPFFAPGGKLGRRPKAAKFLCIKISPMR